MEFNFKKGAIIIYCDDEFEVIKNYGNHGRVKENCKGGCIIDPFYWDCFGEKAKLKEIF